MLHIHPSQPKHVLGLPRGLRLVGHYWTAQQRRCPWSSSHPNCLLSTQKSTTSTPNVWTLHPVSVGEHSSSTSWQSWLHETTKPRHLPELTLNQTLCAHDCASVHNNDAEHWCQRAALGESNTHQEPVRPMQTRLVLQGQIACNNEHDIPHSQSTCTITEGMWLNGTSTTSTPIQCCANLRCTQKKNLTWTEIKIKL